MEDMIIDTDSFDIFSQLDDLVEATPVAAPAKKGKPEPVEEVAEVEDEVDDENFNLSEIDEDEGEESDEDESEEEEEGEESEEDESEESDESDEDEVDYEGYEVTLPNGETVKLNEAIAGYKGSEELKAEKEAFEAAREEFNEKSKDLSSFLNLAKLEAEKVVEDYKDFDWAELSRTDPASYVENREFLDKYKTRLKEIKAASTRLEEEKSTQEAEVMAEKARECVQTLQKDIPGWGKELYGNLMSFAVENGMSEDAISSAVDPSVFKLLFKAYQFDKGKAVAKAKISKVGGSPKKVVKSAPKATISKPSKKAAIEKKLATGKFSSGDLSDAFNFLED